MKFFNGHKPDTVPFVATLQIEIRAKDEAEAQDAISEIFTGNLMHNQIIEEWQYLKVGEVYTSPSIGQLPRGE